MKVLSNKRAFKNQMEMVDIEIKAERPDSEGFDTLWKNSEDISRRMLRLELQETQRKTKKESYDCTEREEDADDRVRWRQ